MLTAARLAAASPAPGRSRIFRDRAAGERASFLVLFREQADLSGASRIPDRTERRRFVFEALRARADESQAPVAARLARDGVRVRSHYLVNMLEVESDERTARALAREPGVLAVAANRPAVLAREASPVAGLARRAPPIEPNSRSSARPTLWALGFTGQGVVVGIADTGVEWSIRRFALSTAAGTAPRRRTPTTGTTRSMTRTPERLRLGLARALRRPGPRHFGRRPGRGGRRGRATRSASRRERAGSAAGTWTSAPGRRRATSSASSSSWRRPMPTARIPARSSAPTSSTTRGRARRAKGCTDPDILRAVGRDRCAPPGSRQSFAAGNGGPRLLVAVQRSPDLRGRPSPSGATDLGDGVAGSSARGPVLRDGSNRIKPDIMAPGVGVRTSCRRRRRRISTASSAARPRRRLTSPERSRCSGRRSRTLAGRVDETEELLEASAVPLTSGIACGGLSGGDVPNPIFGWGRLDVAAATALATLRVCARAGRRRAPEPREVRSASGSRRRKTPALMAILSTKEDTPTRTVLEIEVPAEEVEKAFARSEAPTRARPPCPGSGRGKAPESVVAKRFAEEIKGDVLENLLPDAVSSAIEERKLAILGRPHVEDLTWEPPGPIRFLGASRPQAARSIPGSTAASRSRTCPSSPSDEEVAKVIDRIREAHAEFHPVEGRAAAPGDFAVADIRGSFVEILAPGQNPRTFRDEKITLEVGHADSMPEINEALRGALPGETRTFRKTFPDDFPNDEFRGKTVDYEVTLAALKEKKPAGARRRVRPGRLGGGHGRRLCARRSGRACGARRSPTAGAGSAGRSSNRCSRAATFRRPRSSSSRKRLAALRDYARYLAASGVDPEKEDWAKLRDEARPGAERRVKEYLLLDAIAEREEIEVSDTELEAEFKRAAARARGGALGPARADGEERRAGRSSRRDAPLAGRGPLD